MNNIKHILYETLYLEIQDRAPVQHQHLRQMFLHAALITTLYHAKKHSFCVAQIGNQFQRGDTLNSDLLLTKS